jgi:hypothetical protein
MTCWPRLVIPLCNLFHLPPSMSFFTSLWSRSACKGIGIQQRKCSQRSGRSSFPRVSSSSLLAEEMGSKTKTREETKTGKIMSDYDRTPEYPVLCENVFVLHSPLSSNTFKPQTQWIWVVAARSGGRSVILEAIGWEKGRLSSRLWRMLQRIPFR